MPKEARPGPAHWHPPRELRPGLREIPQPAGGCAPRRSTCRRPGPGPRAGTGGAGWTRGHRRSHGHPPLGADRSRWRSKLLTA